MLFFFNEYLVRRDRFYGRLLLFLFLRSHYRRFCSHHRCFGTHYGSLCSHDGSLPLGAVAIAIGVVLVYKPSIIGEYAMLLIASFILAFAAIEIGEAVAMIFFKQKKFWIASFFKK